MFIIFSMQTKGLETVEFRKKHRDTLMDNNGNVGATVLSSIISVLEAGLNRRAVFIDYKRFIRSEINKDVSYSFCLAIEVNRKLTFC